MKLPWISRRAGAEQLAREIRNRAEQFTRERAVITAAADARVLAISQQLEWMQKRNEQLTDTIVAFKKDGYATPVKGSVKQARDIEAEALARAEGQLTQQFLSNAERDIIEKTGCTAAEAKREAHRLREEAVSEHPAEG